MSRYWVGNGGTWNAVDTTHWSASSGGAGGASVPSLNDDVYFDANSFSSAGQTVTKSVTTAFHNLTISGVTNSPTLAISNAVDLDCYGDITIESGMTITSLETSELWLRSSGYVTRIHDLDTNGVDLGDMVLRFDVGNSWRLSSDLVMGGIDFAIYLTGYFSSGKHNITLSDTFDAGTVEDVTLDLSYSNITCMVIEIDATSLTNTMDLTGANITTTQFIVQGNLQMESLTAVVTGGDTAEITGDSLSINRVLFEAVNDLTVDGSPHWLSITNSYINTLTVVDQSWVSITSDSIVIQDLNLYGLLSTSHDLSVMNLNLYDNNATSMTQPSLTVTAGYKVEVESINRFGTGHNSGEIVSGTAGTTAYIQLAKRHSAIDYIDFQDVTVTGSNILFAGDNAVDNGNNKNIVWSTPNTYSGSKNIVAELTDDEGITTVQDNVKLDYSVQSQQNSVPTPLTLLFSKKITDDVAEIYKIGSVVKLRLQDVDAPVGVLIYQGRIEKVAMDFDNDLVSVAVYNDSYKLNQTTLMGADNITHTNNEALYSTAVLSYNGITVTYLKGVATSGATGKVSYMKFYMINSEPTSRLVYLTINNVVARTEIPTGTSWAILRFATPVTVTPNSTFTYKITGQTSGAGYNLYVHTSDVGTYTKYVGSTPTTINQGIICQAFEPSVTTNLVFTDEPVESVLKTVLDYAIDTGIDVDYANYCLPYTGQTMTYTFNANTCIDAISKCMEYLGSDWIWYIDPAINRFYLKHITDVIEQRFYAGGGLTNLSEDYSVEQVANRVFFTGGDTGGGVTYYKLFTNASAITNFGVRDMSLFDSRVTTDAEADTLVDSVLSKAIQPTNKVALTVVDNNGDDSGYDIESLSVGMVVVIGGYDDGQIPNMDEVDMDNFNIDYEPFKLASQISYISSIDLTPSMAVINLNDVPTKVSSNTYKIQRDLEKSLTANNPDSPTV